MKRARSPSFGIFDEADTPMRGRPQPRVTGRRLGAAQEFVPSRPDHPRPERLRWWEHPRVHIVTRVPQWIGTHSPMTERLRAWARALKEEE
jgi:hypothetical protein